MMKKEKDESDITLKLSSEQMEEYVKWATKNSQWKQEVELVSMNIKNAIQKIRYLQNLLIECVPYICQVSTLKKYKSRKTEFKQWQNDKILLEKINREIEKTYCENKDDSCSNT